MDLTTLDLFSIHRDRALLAKLHELQRARCDEHELVGDDRPGKLRLSIEDPVRRVKAVWEPFWKPPIDEGIGTRGHVLEDYLEVALFHAGWDARLAGKPYASQVVINWHPEGRSAFDWVVESVDGADRVVSCKSSIKDRKPSAANRSQEARMLTYAGYASGTVWETWMIDPSSMRATGPFLDTLTDEDVQAARVELERMTFAFDFWSAVGIPVEQTEGWNDPAFWLDRFGLESSSGAFRYPSLDASGAIEARVRMYLAAKKRAAEAAHDLDTAKNLIRPHVEEQIADADTNKIAAYSADEIATFSIDKRGAMRVTTRPHQIEGAA